MRIIAGAAKGRRNGDRGQVSFVAADTQQLVRVFAFDDDVCCADAFAMPLKTASHTH